MCAAIVQDSFVKGFPLVPYITYKHKNKRIEQLRIFFDTTTNRFTVLEMWDSHLVCFFASPQSLAEYIMTTHKRDLLFVHSPDVDGLLWSAKKKAMLDNVLAGWQSSPNDEMLDLRKLLILLG